MPIYTKTGDHGQTSLVGGQRVSKCCERLESYGTVDELNSYAGLLIGYCTEASDRQFLTQVQTQLFIVGGYLATDTSAMAPRQGNIVEPGMVAAI
jgi:cob(I)alamin adenosyltransferase